MQRGGSSSSSVILSAAKNLVVTAEILRYAQNDKLLSYFRRAALTPAEQGFRTHRDKRRLTSLTFWGILKPQFMGNKEPGI